MYKVFVNNKPLTFCTKATDAERNLPFLQVSDFYQAIDLLNHNARSVTIFSPELDQLWEAFSHAFKQIHAAGGVVFNPNQELLWIYRLGTWDLPKGKVEIGESLEEAAVREVEEECGITGPKIVKDLPTTYHIYYHKKYILKKTYWFEMKYEGNETPVPQKEEGITDIRWISKSEWNEPLNNTYANIINLLESYL